MQRTKKRPGAANSGALISSLVGCESANDHSEFCEGAQGAGELMPVDDAPASLPDAEASADARPMALPTATIAARAVAEEFDRLGTAAAREMEPSDLSARLLARINAAIAAENARDKTHNRPQIKRRFFDRLDHAALAEVVLCLRHVALVNVGGFDRAGEALAVYVDDPADPLYGVYTLEEESLERFVAHYCLDMTTRDWEQVRATLRRRAPRRAREQNADLIAVNNGIFDYSTKQLMDFDPEQIFLSKSPINYRADAESPVIVMPDGASWDVESWMADISDDPAIVDLLWKVVGAVLRPGVHWDKAIFPYSTVGSNGKGTYLALLRGLTDSVSITLEAMGKPYGLAPLVEKSAPSAILVDENPVGVFVDRAAEMKALVTHDVVSVEPKFRNPISMTWTGIMVQCLNGFPRVRDRSQSFLRRLLFVPFDKCFQGVERRYIKSDYLARTDVLEYVLKRVLVGMEDYYELPEPAACAAVRSEFQMENDPVSEFWAEFRDEFKWTFVPYRFLFDLYKSWMAQVAPRREVGTQTGFTRRIGELVAADAVWRDAGVKRRPGGDMADPELLIADWELERWYDPKEAKMLRTGQVDRYKLAVAHAPGSYRGLVRVPRPVPAVPVAPMAPERIAELNEAAAAARAAADPAVTEVAP